MSRKNKTSKTKTAKTTEGSLKLGRLTVTWLFVSGRWEIHLVLVGKQQISLTKQEERRLKRRKILSELFHKSKTGRRQKTVVYERI